MHAIDGKAASAKPGACREKIHQRHRGGHDAAQYNGARPPADAAPRTALERRALAGAQRTVAAAVRAAETLRSGGRSLFSLPPPRRRAGVAPHRRAPLSLVKTTSVRSAKAQFAQGVDDDALLQSSSSIVSP